MPDPSASGSVTNTQEGVVRPAGHRTSGERVVVAGAGPVGLCAASVLVDAGVPVTVCERGPGLSGESRASTFHPSSLELLAELGVVDDLLAEGLVARTFQYRERDAGVVAELDLGILADDTAFPFRLQLEQSRLGEHLLARLERAAADGADVEVRFDHPVTGFAPLDGGGVRVAIDGHDAIDARYAIGADGAHSAVRDSLGVDFPGMTFEERFLVVSTTHEIRDHVPDLAYVNYVSDPDEWLVLLRTPNHWRILFPIPPDEDDDDAVQPARIAQRLDGVFPGAGVAVAHHTLYRVHQRIAETYRSGDAFLAGDAAHINNPLGGMGMNSGIHDAFALAWRLARVWRGDADDGLLDEYARLRRQVTVDTVDAQTRKNFATLASPDPAARRAAMDDLAAIAADPARARDYLLHTSLLRSMHATVRPEAVSS